MTLIEQNYWKVDIQYLQKSQLLVVAKTAEAAAEMVRENIADGTELFAIGNIAPLTDDEKEWVLKNMQGLGDTEDTQERTIN